ncbi:uncharacterized protein LOC129221086 [Uloborus diversus]|uniref:uncharacterized protein LOC129221086 n=1 Tax=Uloborus diversus TaxID=327109 RepID=UPI002409E75D|nr:uncharacterized protein LOC129221086 [Uloborus diversus]
MFLANPGDPNRKGIDLRNLENSVPAGKRRRKQSPEATAVPSGEKKRKQILNASAAASQKRRRAEKDEAVAGPIQSVKPIGSNQASTSAPGPSDLVRVPKSVLDGIHAELRQLREKIASNDQVIKLKT